MIDSNTSDDFNDTDSDRKQVSFINAATTLLGTVADVKASKPDLPQFSTDMGICSTDTSSNATILNNSKNISDTVRMYGDTENLHVGDMPKNEIVEILYRYCHLWYRRTQNEEGGGV